MGQAISRILSSFVNNGNHDHLTDGCRSPGTSCDLPGSSDGQPSSTSLFGLAPDGVYHAPGVTTRAVSSYLTISTLPVDAKHPIGGVFSVALILRLPTVRVTNRHAL